MLRKTIRGLLVLFPLLLLADGLLSLFATCEQVRSYSSTKQTYEKECTAFGGPIVRNMWDALTFVGYGLHAYDKEIVALFTVILTLSTIALWWSTRKLWVAGEKQIEAATRAANAADLSARAAIALQLPVISIHPDGLSHGDGRKDGREYEEVSVPSVTISNLGTTKAFPFEILHGWYFGDELPPEPSYRFLDTFPPNSILEPDRKSPQRQRLTLAMPLTEGEWAKTLKGNYLWFYCELRYRDFMQETRSHGFCWRWANAGMGLGWRVESASNYNRKT